MKRAIVIGATSGIGRALAERLAAEGYRVGVTGGREALLEELAASRPAAFVTPRPTSWTLPPPVRRWNASPESWAAWICAWSAPEPAT